MLSVYWYNNEKFPKMLPLFISVFANNISEVWLDKSFRQRHYSTEKAQLLLGVIRQTYAFMISSNWINYRITLNFCIPKPSLLSSYLLKVQYIRPNHVLTLISWDLIFH
jgi:hypothetical protein